MTRSHTGIPPISRQPAGRHFLASTRRLRSRGAAGWRQTDSRTSFSRHATRTRPARPPKGDKPTAGRHLHANPRQPPGRPAAERRQTDGQTPPFTPTTGARPPKGDKPTAGRHLLASTRRLRSRGGRRMATNRQPGVTFSPTHPNHDPPAAERRRNRQPGVTFSPPRQAVRRSNGDNPTAWRRLSRRPRSPAAEWRQTDSQASPSRQPTRTRGGPGDRKATNRQPGVTFSPTHPNHGRARRPKGEKPTARRHLLANPPEPRAGPATERRQTDSQTSLSRRPTGGPPSMPPNPRIGLGRTPAPRRPNKKCPASVRNAWSTRQSRVDYRARFDITAST